MAEKLLNEFVGSVKRWIATAFRQAGHSLTGELIRDIEVVSKAFGKELGVEGWIRNYGVYLDRGVPHERIPYRMGSGAGHSLYIEGLIRYVRKRLNIADARQGKSVAFAIAYKQKYKRYGMPIRTRGKGTGWLTRAMEMHDNDIRKFVMAWATREMDIIFSNLIRKYQRKFKAV